MSIALESGRNRIKGSAFLHGMSCISISDSSEPGRLIPGFMPGDRHFPQGNVAVTTRKVEEREEELGSCSSSIGRDSDLSGRSADDADSGETEVQSSYKGPLDTMDALEDVLPIRRGISKFYSGKSKSFTSLEDASSCSSVKEFAKPENAYTRKRKNQLACSIIYDKHRSYPPRSNGSGISKRSANSSRSTLALAVAMSSSDSNNSSDNSNSPPPQRPPLHPQVKPLINNSPLPSSLLTRSFSPWRSFSLTDLQYAAAATTGSMIGDRDKQKPH